jgi:hypothetical protein
VAKMIFVFIMLMIIVGAIKFGWSKIGKDEKLAVVKVISNIAVVVVIVMDMLILYSIG